MATPGRSFTIPKKKRIVEAPPEEDSHVVSPIECVARITECAAGSNEYKSLVRAFTDTVSNKAVRPCIEFKDLKQISNPYLEKKFADFKLKLTREGQSDQESLGFLLIGFDPEDVLHIATHGYSIGTTIYGDLGDSTQGVYLYKHVDLTTAALIYRKGVQRIMAFKTLRGRSSEVGLNSPDLCATLHHNSHVPAADEMGQSRVSMFRKNAVYHYELTDMSIPVMHPSGVLPIAVFDLVVRSDVSKAVMRDLCPELELSRVFDGYLPNGAIFGGSSFTLEALGSDSPRSLPINLSRNIQLDTILSWNSVFSDDSNLFGRLFTSELAGRLPLQPEVILAEIRGLEVTTTLFASYFVFTCLKDDFSGAVEDLRLEQKFVFGLAGRDVSVYLFPSSDVSGRLGLPWLEWPHLHCVVIGTGQSLFYPAKENVTRNLLETYYLTHRNDAKQAIDPFDYELGREWERLHQTTFCKEPDLAQRRAAFDAQRRPPQPNSRPRAPMPPSPPFPSGRPPNGFARDERAVVDMECDSPGDGSPNGMNISPPPPPIVLRSPSKLKSCLKVRSQPQPPRRIGPPMANIGTGQPTKRIRWADTEGKSLSNYSSFNKDEASHEIKRRDMQKKEREEEKKANLKKRLSAKEEEEQIEQTKVTNNLFKDAFSSLSSASLSAGVSTDISPPPFVPPPLEPSAMVEDSIVGNGNGNRKMPILKKSVISMLPLPKFADSIADKAGNNTPPTTSNGEEQGNSNSGALWCSDDMEIDSDEDSQETPTEENSEEKTMEQEDSVFHDPADIDYDMHFKECDVPVKEDSNSQSDTAENSMDGDSGRASAASASLEEGGTPDAVQSQPEQNGTEPANDDEDDTCEDSRLTDLVARIINKRKTAPSTSTSQTVQSPSEPSNETVAEAPASPPRVPPDLHRIMNQIRSIPLRSSNSISEDITPTPSAEVPQDEDIRIQLATVTPPRRSRFDVRPPDAVTIPPVGVPSSSTQPADEIPPAASPEPTTEDVDMRVPVQPIPTVGKLTFSIKSGPKKDVPLLPALSVFNALNDDDEEEPTTSNATPNAKTPAVPSKDVDLREKRDDDRHRRSSDSSRRRRSRSRERDRDSRRDRDRRDRDRDRRRGRDDRDSRREESRDRQRREDRDRREESRERERRRRDYDGREERREKDKDERKLGKEKVLPADFFTVPPPLVQQAVSGIEKTTEKTTTPAKKEPAAQTAAAKNHDRVEDKLQSLLIQHRRLMHEREEAAKAAAENQPAPTPAAAAPFPVVQPAASHQPAGSQPPPGPTTPNSMLTALGISSPAVTQVFGGPPYGNNGAHTGQNTPAYQHPPVDGSSFGGPPYEEVLQKPTPFFSSITVKREPLVSSPPPPASPDAPASPDGQSDTTAPLPIPIIDTSSPGLWTPSSDVPTGPGGAYNTAAYHQTAQPIPTSPSKKAKKPKDLDNLKEPANQTGKVIHSWDQVIQKKNEKGKNSQDNVDEEEEGEIKSDGEEELRCLKPTPFVTGPDSPPPAHLNHGFAPHDPDMRPPMHGQPVHEFAEPFHHQHPSSSGWNPHEERKVIWRHEMPPSEPNGPYGPMHPPPRFAPPAPANPVVVPVSQKKQFLVVPDSMSMNPIVLSPDVIESFCDKMKRTATMDPELQCTFMPHARLMTYIFEQSMNNSLPPGTKNKYLHYLSTLRRYEELGVVKVMSEHHCDSTPNRSQDNTLNCLIFIQGQYRRDNPAAEVIYMSNVSPTCEFGQRLTACGIRIMKASTLIEKFPFFD